MLLLVRAALPAVDYFPPPDGEGGWRALATAEEIRAKAGMDLRGSPLNPRAPFNEGSLGGEALWRVLEFVAGAVRDP
ncbi:MAG: hypothetical protein ABMA13_22105 [Chthoniobacteraceae bacterium]